MKVFVTGIKGQLGHDVMNELRRRGHIAIGTDIEEMDITDAKSVEQVITNAAPEAVIHCAAWTAVDDAEDNEEICRRVNAGGTENVARVCKKLHCKMMYISTDYVFDGEGSRPWEPDDPVTEPLNVYGLTKYEGEEAVRRHLDHYFIVRIAWVFGLMGKNFIRTMLRLGETHDRITVVNDQYGTPTYTPDLARLLIDMIETDKYGYYHATNEGGYITWYELACEIFRQTQKQIELVPVTSAEYPSKAKRPSNSRLSKQKLEKNGFQLLPAWKDALARYLLELAKEQDEIGGKNGAD